MTPSTKIVLLACAAVGVLLAVISVAVATSKARAKRRGMLTQWAAARGLTYLPKADRAFATAWSVVKPLLKSGTASHVMYGTLPSGLTVTIFEHQHAVSTGKSVHVVTHGVFAAETPDWPTVSLERHGTVTKWLLNLLNRGTRETPQEAPTVDDSGDTPDLSSNWGLLTDDPTFAEALLGPDLRAVIDAWEHARWWWFTGGKMVLLVNKQLDPEVLAGGVEQLELAWRAIPTSVRITEETRTTDDPEG